VRHLLHLTVEKGVRSINKFTRTNEAIRAPELRVIDENGNQIGILSRNEALAMARASELDLVEISPDAKPPVAKIVDFGKYNYQRTKQLAKNKRNAKISELKQIRYGLKIGDHDIKIKGRKIAEFFEDGHKVRLTVVFRGRELSHKELGYALLEKIINFLGENVVKEHEPQLAGKQLSVVVRSSGNGKAKDA
jgi:translation initiation factor IF-3